LADRGLAVAPAPMNAIHDATGGRIRQLPFSSSCPWAVYLRATDLHFSRRRHTEADPDP
jgi:hypothetical protein